MSRIKNTAFSALDLAPIRDDGTPAQALHNALALARHVEQLGFTRFWVAEHHNMDGIASAATAVLLGYLAAHTQRIRLGAGGVMLPNHAPLVIAEQFGTLEALYPGGSIWPGPRPGPISSPRGHCGEIASAARTTSPADVEELQALLGPAPAEPAG